MLALAQDDLKRLLAYDTVSQMGVLTVGLATGARAGIAGAVYHLVNHALFKSLLFLCAGAIVHRTGATKLSQMGGLARRMPLVAGAFVIGAAAIAGMPPLNGYVSLSLIHHGLTDTHQTIPLIVVLFGQLITIAALGRAAWLAFFRAREDEYDSFERLRPGMVTALGGLALCCVAFGVLPTAVLNRMMAPAAAGLLNPGLVRLPHLHVPLTYLDVTELTTVGASVLLAGLLVRIYLRIREPAPVRMLRTLHNGSVNDYAAYVVAGTIILIAALRLG